MEFYKVTELMGNIDVNIILEREHVGEVDRMIQTVKERGR